METTLQHPHSLHEAYHLAAASLAFPSPFVGLCFLAIDELGARSNTLPPSLQENASSYVRTGFRKQEWQEIWGDPVIAERALRIDLAPCILISDPELQCNTNGDIQKIVYICLGNYEPSDAEAWLLENTKELEARAWDLAIQLAPGLNYCEWNEEWTVVHLPRLT